MDEDDLVATHVEDIDALLALQEDEIEFEERSSTSEEEEPELVQDEPEELPTIAIMSVVVEGTTLNLEQTPTVLTTTSMTIFKKENRSKLTEEKRADHFSKATAAQQTDKYKMLSLSIVNEDDLQDTYNLQMCIEETKQNFERYDMGDVFTVLTTDATGNVVVLGDLFEHYVTISPEKVAESNTIYSTLVKASDHPWIRENLTLTFDYFRNNADTETYRKALETYNSFDLAQRGGPLFFKIMMTLLQTDSVAVVQALKDRLTKMNLKNYEGEDVMKAVSHIRGVIKRLRGLEKTDSTGHVTETKVPPDLSKTLLEIFQTSSDAKFNKMFEQLFLTGFQASITAGEAGYGKPEFILKQAESYYSALYASDYGWTGEVQKKQKSVFTAGAAESERPCFNCGGLGHDFASCSKPKNEDRIKQNRQKYFEARDLARKNQGRSGRDGRG